MTKTQIELMKSIKINGASHYWSLGQNQIDNHLALCWLVRKGFISAWGSTEWREALFSLTEKGRLAVEKVAE